MAQSSGRRRGVLRVAATVGVVGLLAAKFLHIAELFVVLPGRGLASAPATLGQVDRTTVSSSDIPTGVSPLSAQPVTVAACVLAAAGLLSVWPKSARAGQSPSKRKVICQARGGDSKAPLVVIAGPPAAGKGTQCDKIKDKYGYVHISTGDILRENVKAGTELGLKAKDFMDKGALVPSELIVDLVKDRLTQADVTENGCLLDGFPRAPDQAQAMVDAGIKVEKFLVITVPDDTLVERGCGRRLDPETGDIYHLKFKPPPADIVERLIHRSDDQEEKIRARLQTYHDQIDGITPFFKEVVCQVDGTGSPGEVFDLVQKNLDGL